jgi:hypothetical protein
LPPKSANTVHKHIRAEEFYFVLEGVGRIRIGDETLTVPKYGGDLRNVVFGRVEINVPSIVFVSCCRKFIVPD